MRIKLGDRQGSSSAQRAATLLLALTAACGPTVAKPSGPSGPPPATDEPTAVVPDAPVPKLASSEPVFQQTHRDYAAGLDISADGNTAAVISNDGVVSVIDTNTGEVRASRRVWVRSPYQLSVQFAARSSRLLISGASGQYGPDFYVWDLDSGSWFRGGSVPGVYQGVVAISPDGSRVAWGQWGAENQDATDEQKVARVYVGEVGNPTPSASFVMKAEATEILWSSDGNHLLVQDGGTIVGLYDVDAGKTIQTDAEFDAAAMAFSPDGSQALLIHRNGVIVVVDAKTGRLVTKGELPQKVTSLDLRWSAEPDRVLLVLNNTKLLAWDRSASAEPTFTEVVVAGAAAADVAASFWSEDGSALFTQSSKYAFESWDSTTGAYRNQAVPPQENFNSLYAMNPSGTVVGTSSGNTQTFWNADGTQRSSSTQEAGEHSVWGVTWLPDSSGLLTWGRAGVELWTAADGARTTACSGSGLTTFGADGTLRYWSGEAMDGLYNLCDPRTGTVHEFPAEVLATSEHGSIYLQRTDGKLQIVDATTHKVTTLLKTKAEVYQALLTNRMVILFGPKAEIVDVGTGKVLHALADEISIWGASLSKDGERLAYQFENTTKILNLADGKQVAAIDGKELSVTLQFAPSGHDYAYAIGTTVSWVTGTEKHSTAATTPVRTLSYSAAGSRLVATLANTQVAIYEVATAKLVATIGDPMSSNSASQPNAIAPDATAIARCTPTGPTVTRVADGTTRQLSDVALCSGISFSPNGAFVAVRQGPVVQLFSLTDTTQLTLRTLRISDDDGWKSLVLAYDQAGNFTTVPEALPYLRMRAAGPIRTAALETVTAVDPASADLVQRFFGGAAGITPPAGTQYRTTK